MRLVQCKWKTAEYFFERIFKIFIRFGFGRLQRRTNHSVLSYFYMIVFASGRTDIPAFYAKWFDARYEAGYFDVRNPFFPTQVSRILVSNIDALVFCSKNPTPILPYLSHYHVPILFQVTITPYHEEIEPGVGDKKKVIEAVRTLANLLGKDHVDVRYDPIFLSPRYSIAYHLKAFDHLVSSLDGATERIIVSFLDSYQNTRRHAKELQAKEWTEEDYKAIGQGFSSSAKAHGMQVQTCYEKRNLVEYGFVAGDCIPYDRMKAWTGKSFPFSQIRPGHGCHCVQTVDIGAYNSCPHRCVYCYANYDEKEIASNIASHHDDSSFLIGEAHADDNITIRKR